MKFRALQPTTINVYRCYGPKGPAGGVVMIEGNTDDDACVFAARKLKCDPMEVIARYVGTRGIRKDSK